MSDESERPVKTEIPPAPPRNVRRPTLMVVIVFYLLLSCMVFTGVGIALYLASSN